MKEYTSFETVDAEQKFSVRTVEVKWGYFFSTRGLWAFRANGGAWWHMSLFIASQIILTAPALIIDTAVLFAILMLKMLYKVFFLPVAYILAIALGLTLVYTLLITGAWQKVINLASAFIAWF